MTRPKEPYIRVRKWDQYQHHKSGRYGAHPLWIKLYLRIVDKWEFQRLPDASKWHAVGFLILAGRTSNKIPLDLPWIAREIGANSRLDLQPFIDMEFIEIVGIPKRSTKSVQLSYKLSSTMKMKMKKRSYSSNVETVDNSRATEYTAQVHDITRRMEAERG